MKDLLLTGVYTAMARSIDKDGKLIDPVNAPWKTGGAFTTPPGWWHSHVNETDEDAWVLPVQDAGLFTYQVRKFSCCAFLFGWTCRCWCGMTQMLACIMFLNLCILSSTYSLLFLE